jgi:hypothetical protein
MPPIRGECHHKGVAAVGILFKKRWSQVMIPQRSGGSLALKMKAMAGSFTCSVQCHIRIQPRTPFQVLVFEYESQC